MATHPPKCEIMWIPDGGPDSPTPDKNDAIGLAVNFSAGRSFPICAEHAKRFPIRGWALVKYPPACFYCKGSMYRERRLCRHCRGSGFGRGEGDQDQEKE